MHWADLARYWLGPEGEPRSQARAGDFSELPPGITNKSFDFVILGASIIYSDTDNRSDVDRLLVSQMILGLLAVSEGGTVMVKLAHVERVMTAKVLYILHILAAKLWAVKPLRQHSKQPTFYAIAQGFGKGEQGGRLGEVIAELRAIWSRLTFEGDLFVPKDLDFAITTLELREGKDGFLERMVTMSNAVCKVQATGLENAMKPKKSFHQALK